MLVEAAAGHPGISPAGGGSGRGRSGVRRGRGQEGGALVGRGRAARAPAPGGRRGGQAFPGAFPARSTDSLGQGNVRARRDPAVDPVARQESSNYGEKTGRSESDCRGSPEFSREQPPDALQERGAQSAGAALKPAGPAAGARLAGACLECRRPPE
ncbi:collagen alpha-1(I) chain-like [Sapajus apella]|uniref:Collagen alpha-1(I) chain-like n=1 Tax=Sapajus apella TaxID=9515 RepID=A0A6J3F7A4_SAPAP|nr:collagen alpha-1(I) chain-like [Sapajus apella]